MVLWGHKEAIEDGVERAAMGRTEGNRERELRGLGMGRRHPDLVGRGRS